VAVGLEPACAKACPTQAISFGSKPDMLQLAAERAEELQGRGFQQAGVYDPPGVGGTHVVYVLHHADRPELYQGLPRDPRISPLVRLWKGLAKPIGLAVLGLGLLGGFFHYVTSGPNAVEEADEREAEREIDRAHGGKAAQ
jgi:formate dehydrogenase iron-sulfur subunit